MKKAFIVLSILSITVSIVYEYRKMNELTDEQITAQHDASVLNDYLK